MRDCRRNSQPHSLQLKPSSTREIARVKRLPTPKIFYTLFLINHYAGLPEWSNGAALGAVGLVPTKVRILYPA